MSLPIERYALIGDCQTAGLVGDDGSIDWLCLPRFDSAACFASLLGTADHGHWRIAAVHASTRVTRRYRADTLILETEFASEEGTVRLIDFMSLRTGVADVVRIVEGVSGRVRVQLELILRADYGALVPWVRRHATGITAIAGPDFFSLHSPVELTNKDFRTTAAFTVAAGQRLPFVLTWNESHLDPPPVLDAEAALEDTERFWHTWSGSCRYQGPWRDAVVRSALTLKALTYEPTGGIVAAPTTSLPEQLGGERNWDYRFCWLRDATFTLMALLHTGYHEEALAWREWLLRAAAGKPSQMHIMYGLSGERRLTESELPHLPGYEGSRPVRIGNGAHVQFQLDVFGEVMDVLHQSRRSHNRQMQDGGWRIERAVLDFVESNWRRPDYGIWEVRGPARHFTHSKVMAWVALDRAVKAADAFGLDGPVERWRALAAEIHAEVCAKGVDRRGVFVQSYGSDRLDASLLMVPLIGFLPPSDYRVVATVEAIRRELSRDGFVARYDTSHDVDGLPPGEGALLLCSFWLVDCLVLLGRRDEAQQLFERLLAIRSDVGLLSESYDVDQRRLVGNYPQAFSHVGLINTARNLSGAGGPADERRST